MSPVTIWQKIVAGLFVLLVIAVWIFFSISLRGPQKGRIYHTFLQESVRGLAPGSLVCYNGIEVGKVSRIVNDFANNRVRVDMIITDPEIEIFKDWKKDEETLPGTRAQLVTSLVTGIQYINLTGGGSGYPPLEPQSMILSEDTDFSKLSKKINKISENLEEVLSSRNLENIVSTMKNLNTISERLRSEMSKETPGSLLQKSQKILDNLDRMTGTETQEYFQSTMKNLAEITDPQKLGISDSIQKITKDSQNLIRSIHHLVKDLNEVVKSSDSKQGLANMMEKLNQIISQNEGKISAILANLERFTTELDSKTGVLMNKLNTTLQTLNYFAQKELYEIFRDLKITLQDLSSVLRILKAKPNALFWGSEVRGQ